MTIYVIYPKAGSGLAKPSECHLVRASQNSVAFRHIAKQYFDCEPANAELVATLMTKGLKVEEAGADQMPLPLTTAPASEPEPVPQTGDATAAV